MTYRDDKIRAAKGAMNLTDQELADRAGVSRSTVSNACNGKPINGTKLEAIALALDIPFADLFEPRPQKAVA